MARYSNTVSESTLAMSRLVVSGGAICGLEVRRYPNRHNSDSSGEAQRSCSS